MKRFLFAAAMFFQLSSYAQYQVQKGHWFIGHTIGGYGYTKSDLKQYKGDMIDYERTYKQSMFRLAFSGPDWGETKVDSRTYSDPTGAGLKTKDISVWLQPQGGFFVRDNLMVGASVLMGFESGRFSGTSNPTHTDRSWSLGIGPMMRYYFGKNAKRKSFAGFESRFDFSKEKGKNDYSNDMFEEYFEYFGNGSRIMVRPYAGYAWFLGKRWTADLRINYTYEKETSKREEKYFADGILGADYPKTNEIRETLKTISLSVGIGYTF